MSEDEKERMRGRMDRNWARQHSYYGYYYKRKGKCQNPHCGAGISDRYILRHKLSGDEPEIGSTCYQRWREANNLTTTPWFKSYDKKCKHSARKTPGQIVSQSVNIKHERDSRKEWLLNKSKEGVIKLEQIPTPLENFVTLEAADNWANERGGFCVRTFMTNRLRIHCSRCGMDYEVDFKEKFCLECGTWLTLIDVEGETFWDVYINPEYESGQYIKMSSLARTFIR